MLSRQAARAEARRLSKLWVGTRLRGPRQSRKILASQIANANWRALKNASAIPIEIR